MADNAELIKRFYDAFDRHDGEAMASCYASGVHFEDPAFGELKGEEAGDMWRMLTSGADDLRVELAEHEADEEKGTAHWIAHYTFTQSGRPVVNDIRASFRFADGKIVDHRDSFSFWRWARQALGPVGAALGWNPLFHAAFKRKARERLDEFREGESPAGAERQG